MDTKIHKDSIVTVDIGVDNPKIAFGLSSSVSKLYLASLTVPAIKV